MDEAELKAAEVIARNIELLEDAYAIATEKMDAKLYEASRDIFEEKQRTFSWEYGPGSELNDGPWLAPTEWRAEGEEVGGDYYLVCGIDAHDESETWVAHFAGGPERRVYLTIFTNTVTGVRRLNKLASTITDEVSELAELGFMFDASVFALKLPLKFDREEVAKGFADDDLSTALAPIGLALDKIKEARPILDKVAEAVRRFNA
ncbi:hypothetical protein [Paracoccus sp. MKU1]|uniref:hypothetical protein n=1 Tax=Paracoccus sp. MKU1 TaxID=1745182 RepID=UPI0007191C71|nr:hypothetical protein [Paracoccus sp. MKU1]